METKYGLCASRRINVPELLAMFLFALEGGNANKATKERFQHYGEIVSGNFGKLLEVICKMAIDIIQLEDTDFKEVPKKLRSDDRYYISSF